MNLRQSMINGLIAIAGQAVNPLPDEYVSVDYLICTGEQYVVLATQPSLDWSIKGAFTVTGTTDTQFFWACRKAVGTYPYFSMLNIANSGIRVDYGNGAKQTTVKPVANTMFTLEQNGNKAYYNGTLIDMATQVYGTVDASILIGVANAQDVPLAYYLNGRIYYVTVRNGSGTAVHDLRPVIRLSDRKPGLYDTVTNRFYVNQGTGADFQYNVSGEAIMEALGYVTNGIVECFDGEYNAGISHAAQSDIWTGMIQNDQLTYEGYDTYTWESKCCHFAGTSGYALFRKSWPYAEEQFVGTIEHCGAWSTITGTGTYPTVLSAKYSAAAASMTKASKNGISLVCGVNGWQKNATPTIAANAVTTMAITQAANASYKDYQPYVNASTVAVDYTGAQSVTSWSMAIGCGSETVESSSGGEGRIYCVRVYNRTLTVAELQQNRAVDVARFGTTV